MFNTPLAYNRKLCKQRISSVNNGLVHCALAKGLTSPDGGDQMLQNPETFHGGLGVRGLELFPSDDAETIIVISSTLQP